MSNYISRKEGSRKTDQINVDRPQWFNEQLTESVFLQKFKAFAISLTRNNELAEDLVVQAQIKAMENWENFEVGTNFGAWMCTILRNTFLDENRRENRVLYGDEAVESAINGSHTKPNQLDTIALKELGDRFAELSAEHQEALRLIRVEGLSYEEYAKEAVIALGTAKSRVNRAVENLGESSDYI